MFAERYLNIWLAMKDRATSKSYSISIIVFQKRGFYYFLYITPQTLLGFGFLTASIFILQAAFLHNIEAPSLPSYSICRHL
jgi:hypothetical protein